MKDNCAQLARTKLYVYFFTLLGTDKEGLSFYTTIFGQIKSHFWDLWLCLVNHVVYIASTSSELSKKKMKKQKDASLINQIRRSNLPDVMFEIYSIQCHFKVKWPFFTINIRESNYKELYIYPIILVLVYKLSSYWIYSQWNSRLFILENCVISSAARTNGPINIKYNNDIRFDRKKNPTGLICWYYWY